MIHWMSVRITTPEKVNLGYILIHIGCLITSEICCV
jgi:hypothetical protein